MVWFFIFFFVSGFCSILYELIWLRLSIAQFGVTSAMVSIVLSMFMFGLGLGSWIGGSLVRQLGTRHGRRGLLLYGFTECLIGISALVVPRELTLGRSLLAGFPLSSSWEYYVASGVWVLLTLVPWCAFMGATIPVAMFAIRNRFSQESSRSFSYLYLANVLGAVIGAILPLLLIEIYGFHGTLKIGAGLNFLLAASATALSLRGHAAESTAMGSASSVLASTAPPAARSTLLLLFATGLTSMGLEVVWIRQFTPYLGTVVYAFGLILGVYLAFTFIGSRIYRHWSGTHSQIGNMVWFLLALSVLLPLITAQPHFSLLVLPRLLVGIGPFSALLGFVTPMLVDRWSQGDADRAGVAYAINVVGCVLGPLLSGFLLMPWISERWVTCLFSVLWLVIGISPGLVSAPREARVAMRFRIASYSAASLALLLVLFGKSFEDQFSPRRVMRDDTATIIATGTGMQKRLLVNGIGITTLTPITKMMAHLPMASLSHPPKNALVVCFGMGTTYRSLLSWGVPVTAVELVPSVPKVFSFYHPDAPQLLSSPLSHVVIDDGRRFLERTSQKFDVVTIDPPPPVEAAGSSLLYSKDFYRVIKTKLMPGGILQQWLPFADPVTQAAVARALMESFPYVRAFHSEYDFGYHFLASMQPIPYLGSSELAERLPAKAAADFVEWGPAKTPADEFAIVTSREVPLAEILAQAPNVPAMQDDRPVNEYFILRASMPGYFPVPSAAHDNGAQQAWVMILKGWSHLW
jgi:spermidine synthase